MAFYGNPAFAGHELAMAGASVGASQGEQRQGGHDEKYFKHNHSVNCITVNASLLNTSFVNG